MTFYVLLCIQILLSGVFGGIALFSQVVHFPLYHEVKEGFAAYEKAYLKRLGYIMGPLVACEGISNILLLGFAPEGLEARVAVINFLLMLGILLATFFLSIAQHQKLSVRFSKAVLHELMSCNWITVALWFGKAVVLLYAFLMLKH